MDKEYSKLEKLLHKRVGVIWGNQDKVVPYALGNNYQHPNEIVEKFKLLVPSAHVFSFEEEGHSICVENPTACIESIKEIVKKMS